jgi:two-component system, chemotaxis family, CheB/CheR fusion protein
VSDQSRDLGKPLGDAAAVRELEAELEMSRQRLRQVIEEHETSQEEMRATNEELQSANEELHSTLEELETSKEELQSMNEELVTLNQENRNKVEELGQITSDQQNLLASMEIATVFLDREMRIMRFTPRLGELFNVWHGDRGRPLSDLTHRLGYKELAADASQVLDRLTPVEREIQSEQGRWYLCRVLPYRAEDRIDGVVITFVDITERKEAEDALRKSQEQLKQELEVISRLHQMTMRVVTASELSEAVDEILNAAVELQESDMGDVQLVTADRTGLEILASRGLPESYLDALRVVKIEEDPVSGRAVREKRRITVSDVDSEAAIPVYRGLAAAAGFSAVQATPLISHNGRILGVLTTHYRRPRSLSEHDEHLLDLLAQHVASLIDRFRAEEALKDLNLTLERRVKQVRGMVSRLTMAEQAERRRISEILHDNLQQLLFSIQMKLTFVVKSIEAGEHRELRKHAGEASTMVGDAIECTRRLTVDLSPAILHHEGLLEAIGWLPAHMKEGHGLKVDIDSADVPPVAHQNMRVLLFQVVRELLFNVVKHAETDRARVELGQEDGFLFIKVADEGRGFDPAALESGLKEGFGLFAIQSRLELVGGRMEMLSKPAEGTRITVHVPLSALGETRSVRRKQAKGRR